MREAMKKPVVAGAVIAALLVTAGALSWRSLSGGPTAALAGEVTIRDKETGESWTMVRGVLEKQLYERAYPIDPAVGVDNPKTGKPTGFTSDWEQLVARINAERKALRDSQPGGAPGER